MAKSCVVFSQSPFEDLTTFRIRHVLLLVSILARVTRRDSDICVLVRSDSQWQCAFGISRKSRRIDRGARYWLLYVPAKIVQRVVTTSPWTALISFDTHSRVSILIETWFQIASRWCTCFFIYSLFVFFVFLFLYSCLSRHIDRGTAGFVRYTYTWFRFVKNQPWPG